MGHRDHGPAGVEVLAQQAHQISEGGGILAGGRLIQQHQLRPGGQRGAHRESALLPSGEGEGIGLGHMTQPQPLQQVLPVVKFLGHGGAEELMLGLLEDHP